MKFQNVYLEDLAYVDAPEFLSSTDLENKLKPVYERLKLPEGRLELQTSIKSRGLWPVGESPSSIATSAALKLFDKNEIKKSEIDLLIYSGVCRDFLEPSTASIVHGNLGLSASCQFFDLSNACLGFMQAVIHAGSLIEAGFIKKALVVTGENASPLLEETIKHLNSDLNLTRKSIKPFFANLTIGSSGVAIVVSSNKDNAKLKILGGSLLTDSSASSLCQGDGNTSSLMMQTDSEALLHAGIKLAHSCHENFLKEFDINRSEFSHIITHQVGVAHRNLLYQSLELDLSKDYSSFETYGNTGSAALPLTLTKAVEENRFKANEKIALMGIGSGLHALMMGAECL